ncbi:hypothetical protein Bca4012_025813 [Brassica carinata]
MEPAHDGDEDVQLSSTEFQPYDRTDCTDGAVYRIESCTSGMELRLDPRPDDQTDCTRTRLSRPIRKTKSNGLAKINFVRGDSESIRALSILARLARTACPEDRIDALSVQFDQIMNFDGLNFSKAGIPKLSEGLGRVKSQSLHEEHLPSPADSSPCVLLLTTGHATRFIKPGQE